MKKDDEECEDEHLLELVKEGMNGNTMLGENAIANLIIENEAEIMALLLRDAPRESKNKEVVALLERKLGRDDILGFNSTSQLINHMLPELSTLYEQQSDEEEENDNMLKDNLARMMKRHDFDADKKLSLDKWVSFLMELNPTELSNVNNTIKLVQKNPIRSSSRGWDYISCSFLGTYMCLVFLLYNHNR